MDAKSTIDYYTKDLATPDYYVEDNILSYWSGKGAEKLGLFGEVERDDFIAVVKNKHPQTGEKLKPRVRQNMRVSNDITASVGKDISVLWALTKDEEVKKAVTDSIISANSKMLAEMETMVQTRAHMGLATKNVDTGNMLASSYLQTTSRPVGGMVMPQLHVHNLVKNMTWVEEKGRFHAAQLGKVMENLPYLEAVFHNELAKSLSEKGIPITRADGHYHITGISRETIDAYSSRTKQIEAFCEANNITDPKIKGQIGAKLRESKKTALPKEQVYAHWDHILPDDARESIDAIKINGDGNPPAMSPQVTTDRNQEQVIAASVKDEKRLVIEIPDMPDDSTAVKPPVSNNDKSGLPHISAREALGYALEHELQNASKVSEMRLLRTAIRYGVGSVSTESLRDEYKNLDVLIRTENRRNVITTRAIWNEEATTKRIVKSSKYMHPAFTYDAYDTPTFFNKDQRRAVKGLLKSTHFYTALQGDAGTGKTTVVKTVVEVIERKQSVIATAPTTAARDVLEADGFKHTYTLDKFLHSPKLQEEFKGQVLLLSEAGMVGFENFAKLVEIADKNNMRIIAEGDEKQHNSVPRGDAFRVINKDTGIRPITLNKIIRQKPKDYREAVRYLSKGDVKYGLERLDKMGAIKEIADDTRYKQLANDYVNTIDKGKTALVVTPTHAEKEKVTKEIRNALKASGEIDGKEHLFKLHKVMHLSTAEKKDVRNYEVGQHIHLNQNVRGLTKGENVIVTNITGDEVQVTDSKGLVKRLDIQNAERFNLYQAKPIALAKGDLIRTTKGGTSVVNGQKTYFSNNTSHKIAGFTKEGNIRLPDGRVLSKDFGNIDYGFVTTSHSSQGRTVDNVFIAISSDSFGRATNQQQLYASASRGRYGVSIYTNDKKQLFEQTKKSNERLSATEVFKKGHAFWSDKLQAVIDHQRRIQAFEEWRKQFEQGRDMSPAR